MRTRVVYDRVIDLSGVSGVEFVMGTDGVMILRSQNDGKNSSAWLRSQDDGNDSSAWLRSQDDGKNNDAWLRSQDDGKDSSAWLRCQTDSEDNSARLRFPMLLSGGPGASARCLRIPAGFSEAVYNGSPAGETEAIFAGDFFQIHNYSFYYKDRKLWTQNREDLFISGIPYENLPDRNSYPAFRRNTRIQSYMDTAPVEILDPPMMPAEQEGSIALRLLPSLGMLAAAGFMASRGGAAMLVFSGVSAGTGVLTAVAGTLSAGKKRRRQLRERQRVYLAYLKTKREELEKARELEREMLRRGYPDLEELFRELYRFAPDLFERRRPDEDFLTLRLGTGNVKALKQVHYKSHEQLEALDELAMLPEKTGIEYMWLKDVPVVCDLKKTAVLGITGKEPERFGLLRNIVMDLALHHYHSDVKMIFISSEEHAGRLHWLRFLPHAFLDPQFVRGIAFDAESRSSIFEYIYRELSRRREEGAERVQSTHLLIFFYDDVGFRVHPISRFLSEAKDLGVTFLFFADKRTELVQGCNQVIEMKHPGAAVMTDVLDSERRAYFSFSAISEKKAQEGVLFLAPIYTQEVSLDPTLTRNYTLFQMLRITRAEDLVLNYGKSSAGLPAARRSLAAPIGIGRTGPIYLDIHDAAHGPHGLVAGTTGSGKSELLQTYILSMAVRYHPHEVGFLIIDYKGGGMAGPLSSLPHLLGIITNIDGPEARRALRSIRAELEKRQRLFEKVQVNHIDSYMQLRGTREPLPHLVIIIDEFAELKAAHPEFMEELISAARIGRSLGVHLILATQKPSGQVSEQIWSNSRFRICLKVQEAADSKEVLKSPLAAEIREAGRAYLQVGNREVFELFQSAYSSSPADKREQEQKEFSIYEISDTGKKTLVYQKRKKSSGSSPNSVDINHPEKTTQMDAVVRRIAGYCTEQEIPKLPDVFCPPLAEVIPFHFMQTVDRQQGLFADIGWYDDPDHQLQSVYTMDFCQKHVLIVGSSRSGKTNLLKTIIRDMASRYSPGELHIYIADYASRELTCMEDLRHVGGVVCSSDREKTESLFRMLSTELEHRKTLLANYSNRRRSEKCHSHLEFPHILLVIDQLSVLKELIFQDDQRLLTLCNEGLQVGIHVVATSSLASSIGYRYLSVFGEKIALFCNDTNEYHYLFDHPKEAPKERPGQFVIQRNGSIYHGQCYLAFEDKSGKDSDDGNGDMEGGDGIGYEIRKDFTDGNGIDTDGGIARWIDQVNQSYQNKMLFAKPIPQVPEVLTEQDLEQYYEEDQGSKGILVPVGISLSDISPCFLDVTAQAALIISGGDGMGRHNWIVWIDRYLKCKYRGQYQYFVSDGIHRRLGWMAGQNETVMYSINPEKAGELVIMVESILKERYQSLLRSACTENAEKACKLLILLIDSPEALEIISRSPEALAAWRNITGRYKSLKVFPVVIYNGNISYQAPEILRDLRDMKNCLFFGDLKSFRLFEIPYTVSRQAVSGGKPGEAWLIQGTDCTAVKTPLCSKTR